MKKMLLPLLAAVSVHATDVPTAVNQFTTAFYGKIAPGEGNLICSPFNISAALSMALAGARGQTATEMAAVLHQTWPDTGDHAGLSNFVDQLSKSSNTAGDELAMANGLWVEKGFPIQVEFEQTIRNLYHSPLTPLAFSTNPDAARAEINRWTSEHTKGKIQELFGPGSLDRLTRVVISSAIYFHGKWLAPFQPKNTAPGPFKLAGGRTADASFMNQTGNFGYSETPSLQILEMKYADQNLAFDVLLPKSPEGLGDLQKSFTAGNLASWLLNLMSHRVEVSIPRFRAESQLSLGPTLSELGMPHAFQSSADFSGIDGRRDLYISQAVHKAFVDVAEEGTEAAAATGLAVSPDFRALSTTAHGVSRRSPVPVRDPRHAQWSDPVRRQVGQARHRAVFRLTHCIALSAQAKCLLSSARPNSTIAIPGPGTPGRASTTPAISSRKPAADPDHFQRGRHVSVDATAVRGKRSDSAMAAADHDADNRERSSDRESAAKLVVQPRHLEPHEDQYDRQPVAQHVEPVHGAAQQEVHGAQPENREDVRGIDDQRLARHGENRRHRIHREHHVRGFEQQQHHEQRGRMADAIDTLEETAARGNRA